MWALRIMLNDVIFETTEPERQACLDWLHRLLDWALLRNPGGHLVLEVRAFVDLETVDHGSIN